MNTSSNKAFALNRQAINLASEQKLSEASRLLEQAIRLCPQILASHENLGAVNMMRREFPSALQCFLQALKLDPKSVMSHFNLANIYRELSNTTEAIRHLKVVISIDPNHHSAEHILSACTGATPERAPPEYIKKLFDQYSSHFDQTLVRDLKYRTPNSLASMLIDVLGSQTKFDSVLGCGTGLAGAAFAGFSKRLVGVDISSGMLERAKAKDHYETLINDDILRFLTTTKVKYDLFIAADVLNYSGNLQPIFAGINRCSSFPAHCIFSTETMAGEHFELTDTGRFRHSDAYVRSIAKRNNFEIVSSRTEIIRQEKLGPVQGMLFLLKQSPP
jgi:predicted TPR repeat methyltransferase